MSPSNPACQLLSHTLSAIRSSPNLKPTLKHLRPFTNSTTHKIKQQFLVQVPDFPQTTSQRLSAQKDHIIDATPLIDSKQLSFFGVTLSDSPGSNTAHAKINGSVMVMEADSRDEVVGFLERDTYTKAGVWDVGGAKITPFRSG